jgi:hypothetical protein
MYKVYQLGMNDNATLFLLSLGPERKVKCYNEYFLNGYVFHTEEYGQGRKTYNNGVCVKRSTFSEYYGKLKEVIELQYNSKHNRVSLFKCYWYDTIDRGIMVWSKLTQKLDSATSTMSLFSPNNANKFITNTPFPLEIPNKKVFIL